MPCACFAYLFALEFLKHNSTVKLSAEYHLIYERCIVIVQRCHWAWIPNVYVGRGCILDTAHC